MIIFTKIKKRLFLEKKIINKHIKKSYYNFGIRSELIARIFLRIKFYKIIAIRFKNRFGEIDIIAVKANSLIFIEVKARSKKLTLDEVFSSRQSLRIKSGAEFFLNKHNDFANYNYRFDLITVNRLGFCSHYKNFWQ